MLIKCPECQLQLSDKASFCPHCGYPTRPSTKQKTASNNKRKRLPNGFGQITKLNNPRLRKQFRVMVTIGKTNENKPICKLLKPQAYFETYNDAYEALLEYNRNPCDLDPNITVEELYNRWTDYYFKSLKSASSERTITSAWKYCRSVYKMGVSDLRARHIKYCMDDGTIEVNGEEKKPSASTKSRIKSLFNLMLDYALEYELVDKNYARTFDVSSDIIDEIKEAKRNHIPFAEKEMQILWQNINVPYVDIVLIQCYSGWRPQELGLIEISNVDLINWTFVGGMKTKAGINRTVPIHPSIRPLVKLRYDEAVKLGSKYLFNCPDATTYKGSMMLTYDKYRNRFVKIRDSLKLNPDHRAHDGRAHFITMAKKYNVDEYAIKYIVGHEIDDVTEKVYTQRDISWLHEEISKIK